MVPSFSALITALCLLPVLGCRKVQPAPAPLPVVSGPLASPALVAELTALDRRLFELVFERQDDAALRDLLTEDFHFHHDKTGLDSFTSPEAFVVAIRQAHGRRATGEDLRARREVVADTEEIHPLALHGAIHTGEHRFYAQGPGQPDRLRETATFFHVWRRVEGKWKLAQVYSYAHRPVG